ncbi:hypothetical protein NPIL_677091, partial [Nephila pilipes]
AITFAKRKIKDLAIAWIDLENSFGSVPLRFILRGLELAGVSTEILALIHDLSSDASSQIRTNAGWTDPISTRARQASFHSARIFLIFLSSTTRGQVFHPTDFSLYDEKVNSMVYSDICSTVHPRSFSRSTPFLRLLAWPN